MKFTLSVCDAFIFKNGFPQNGKENNFQKSVRKNIFNPLEQKAFVFSFFGKLSRLKCSRIGICDCRWFHKVEIYVLLLLEDDTAHGCSTHRNLKLGASPSF